MADSVLVLAAVFTAAVLAFIVHNHERFFASPGRIVLFVGLPAAGLTLFLAALKLKADHRDIAAVTILSVSLAAYAAEAFLTVRAGHAVRAEEATIPHGVHFDARTKYQVAMDLRGAGVQAYPSVFPGYILQTKIDGTLGPPVSVDGIDVLPLGGIVDRPTVLCNESGTYIVYHSDEMRFHNPKGLWDAAPLDVAALGDSFTQGYCVPSNANFVARIRARFPRTLNLGMGGSGPLVELATLREFLPSLQPRIVLWFFFEGNNLDENLEVERRSPLLRRYLDDDDFRQRLREKAGPVDAALTRFVDDLYAAEPHRLETGPGRLQTVIGFIGLHSLREALAGGNLTRGAVDFELFRNILASAQRSVAVWNGSLYLVYLPDPRRFATSPDAAARLERIREGTMALARDLRIPVIDVVDAFERQGDPMALFALRAQSHFNSNGHRLVAETVLTLLATR